MEGELPKQVTPSPGAVFVSYASQDAPAVARICEALGAAGIAVWFDQRELRGGDVWDQNIRRQIRDCALFIPVISASTASRPEGYFRLEWDLADQRSRMMARDRMFIIPVCLDATPAAGADLPESFHRVQWTRLPEGITPPEFAARIASLLRPVVVPTAAADPMTFQALAESQHERWWAKKRRNVQLATAAVLLLSSYLLIDHYRTSRATRPTSTEAAVGQQGAFSADGASAPVQLAVPEKSIAVLPFLDISEKHDQEFFSDGLTDELIDQLAHAVGLKVIARTSSFYFKGKQATIGEISRTLAVSHVLEGSVRRAGDALRISAQLVRASDGVQLWSQTFDRDFTDIFRLQKELAGTVAQGMEVALDLNKRQGDAPPSTPEAYKLLLEADFVSKRGAKTDSQKAIELYKKALALDPRYAAAWAKLGQTYLDLLQYGMVGSESIAAAFDRARAARDQALRFDSNLGYAHALAGRLALLENWDWPAAEAAFFRAGELDPSFDAEARIAAIWKAYGHVDDAIDAYRRALTRDPISASILLSLGWTYLAAGRLEESSTTLAHISDLVPSFAGARALESEALLLQGKKQQALETIQQEPDEAWKISMSPIVYWDMERRSESDAALHELEERFAASSAYNVAEMRAYRGEIDAAFRWLDRAYRQRDPGITGIKLDPLLRNLRGDARFEAMLIKLKIDGDGPAIRRRAPPR